MASRRGRRRTWATERLERRELLAADAGAAAELVKLADPAKEGYASAQKDERIAEIINGELTDAYPQVVLVNDVCSGTLISPTHVLTAAHCTEGLARDEGYVRVDGRRIATTMIVDHPDYDTNAFFLGSDLSIYTLDQPVEEIDPATLLRRAPRVGDELILVGYGVGGSSRTGQETAFGTLREGRTRLDQLSGDHLEWTLSSHDESNTAPGDSGGPAFIDVEGRLLLAGVTSGGSGASTSLGGSSFDTRVDVHLEFLDSVVGGTYSLVDDVGDSAAAATALEFDSEGVATASGRLEIAHDRDFFEFTVEETSSIEVLMRGSSLEDPYLRLLNSAGVQVDFDDDGGPGRDSRVERSRLRPGTYYVSAGAYGDHYAGGYRLTVTLGPEGATSQPDDPPQDPGDDAPLLAWDESQRAAVASELDPVGDRDVYRFELSEDASVAASLIAEDFSLDPYLRIYDAEGGQFAADDDGGAGFDSRLFRYLPAGVYYVSAGAYQDGSIGEYTLTLSAATAGASTTFDPPSEPTAGSPELRFDVHGVARTSGVLAPEADADVYSFQLAETSSLLIRLADAQAGLDAYLRLMNSAGETIVESDDDAFSLNSALEIELTAGLYYVEAGSFEEADAGAFDLTIYNFTAAGDPSAAPGPGAAPISWEADGAEVFGFLDSALDRDVWQWEMEAPGAVALSLLAEDQFWDPLLRVFDAAGNEIAVEDGFSFDPFLSINLSAGRHYVSVETGSGDSAGVYRLLATRQEGDPPEGVDAAAPALEFDGFGRADVRGVLFDSGDRDAFRLSMPTDGAAVIRLAETDHFLDPRLLLYDASGELVAENDDADDFSVNSRLNVELAAGEYYVVAASWEDVVEGAYELNVVRLLEETPPSAPPVAATSDDAQDVDWDEHGRLEVIGRIDVAGDVDRYRLELPVSGSLTAFLEGDDELDPLLRLLDSDGVQIAINDDAIDVHSRISLSLDAGVYVLSVEGFEDAETGAFRLSVTRDGVDVDATPRPPTPRLSLDAEGRALVEGRIDEAGDRDVYQLAVEERANVVVELIAGDEALDPFVRLYDAAGTVIAYDDDSGGADAARLELTLAAGDYFLSAGSHLDESSGAFELAVAVSQDDLDVELDLAAGVDEVLGAIDSPGDRDSAWFSLRRAARVRLSVSSEDALPPALRLFNDRGDAVAVDESDGAYETRLQPGRYRVETAPPENDWLGEYALSAELILPGDVNRDGRVDLEDFGVLKANFGLPGDAASGDVNRDGQVALDDFALLKANFNLAYLDFVAATAAAGRDKTKTFKPFAGDVEA